MSDLISRKGIIRAHKEYCEKHPEALWYKWSLSIMQTAPSIDAEKVVRCIDCEHYTRDWHMCEYNERPLLREGDDYCSRGERRRS